MQSSTSTGSSLTSGQFSHSSSMFFVLNKFQETRSGMQEINNDITEKNKRRGIYKFMQEVLCWQPQLSKASFTWVLSRHECPRWPNTYKHRPMYLQSYSCVSVPFIATCSHWLLLLGYELWVSPHKWFPTRPIYEWKSYMHESKGCILIWHTSILFYNNLCERHFVWSE